MWIRLETSWALSEWLAPLSSEARLCWVMLLCHVKAQGQHGTCRALSPLVAARHWFVGEESVRQMLMAAEAHGALVVSEGVWTISKWRDYQGDPTAAERQRRRRDRQKEPEQPQNVTLRHGCHALRHGVTPTEQNRTEQDRTYKQEGKGGYRGKTQTALPGRGEWVAYALSLGLSENDANATFDHYESVGWVTAGRKPIVDWQACVRTCLHRRKADPQPAIEAPPDDPKPPARPKTRLQIIRDELKRTDLDLATRQALLDELRQRELGQWVGDYV